jgi:hypothetical protein
MAFQKDIYVNLGDFHEINPGNFHEVVLRELDNSNGCFLSDLGSVLGQRGLLFDSREINNALATAAKDNRLVLEFRTNGSHPDLFIRARHYPSNDTLRPHLRDRCSDPVCNSCHPETFV